MRLSHLTALAVLVALVGAMFVAMNSAAAISYGACGSGTGDSGTNYLTVGDTCTLAQADVKGGDISTKVEGNAVQFTEDLNNDKTKDDFAIRAVYRRRVNLRSHEFY